MHIRRDTLLQNREQIRNYNDFEKKSSLEEMKEKNRCFSFFGCGSH